MWCYGREMWASTKPALPGYRDQQAAVLVSQRLQQFPIVPRNARGTRPRQPGWNQ